MSDRKDQLLRLCETGKEKVLLLVDEIVFIESKLEEIKKLPFYKVHPNDKLRQKLLPAGKLYKELLQQYNQSLKVFASMTGKNIDSQESALRKWVKARNANTKKDHMDPG